MQDCENDVMVEDSKRALNETPGETDERETSYEHLPSVHVESPSPLRIGTILSNHTIASLHSNPKIQQSTVRLEAASTKVMDENHNFDAFGFVNGDFTSGKILDLPVVRCYVMAYSVTGDLLAVGSHSTGVAFYETQTFSLVHVVERSDVVSALQWLQLTDGSLFLAVGGLDGVSTLYSIESDLLELQGATVIHEFRLSAQVRSMTLSMCDDDAIAWTVGDKSGTVTLCGLSPHDSQSIQTTEYHYGAGILGLAVNAAVTLLAISTKGGEVIVARIIRNKDNSLSLGGELYNVQRHGPVRSIVFTKDERHLIFGGYDKMVVVVDTKLWAITRELNVEGTINTLSCDPLERYLAVGARDKTFVLYDTSSWCPLKTIHTPGWVTSISWGTKNEQGDLVAVRSEPNCISILDLTPIHVATIQMSSSGDPERSLSWTRDGYFVARTKGDKVVIADARNGFVDVASMDTGGLVRCIAFCTAKDKSNALAVVNTAGYLFVLELRFADSSCTLEIKHSSFIEENLWVVAWSSDGKLLATGGKGKILHIFSTSDFRRKRDPMTLAGRVWGVDFIPGSLVATLGEKASGSAMAVGTGDYVATLYDGTSYQPTLQITRTRTVRCVKYHPSLPLLAIGDGSNHVAIIDYVDEEPVEIFNVGGRVNCLDFSPNGDFLVVGTDDCRFTIHETVSYKSVQEIVFSGFAMSAAFSPTTEYLTLGCANGDYSVVRLGPLLATDLIPLNPTSGLNSLPFWALNEALYRSGNGPSLVQRYMLDGSAESLQLAVHVLHHYPDAMYTFNRTNRQGCFDTAISLQKPNLLKLTLTALVDGTLEGETSNGRKRSILTTDLPEQGAKALYDMIFNQPPQLIVDILAEMTFLKVPFTQPHVFSPKNCKEMGSSSYTDPWQKPPSGNRLKKLELEDAPFLKSSSRKGKLYRTPAVLPLPGLGEMKFLGALIDRLPPSVFDNDAMGLVLRVMWKDYIRFYFLADVLLFLVLYALWIVYVDWTASTTESSSGMTASENIVALALLAVNSLFGLKEIIQSDTFRRLSYFKSPWNVVDLLSIALVYAYIFAVFARGGAENRLVPLVVFATLFLTLKLLAYLRGFGDTGWLISVLRANFVDVRGFAIVLLCCLFGFALMFRVLYGNIPGICEGDDGTECDLHPFGSFGRSLLSTFELAVLGVYDPAILSDGQFRILSVLCFVLAVMSVLVIALNALIAVLSDSYARVQENATANRRRERAELIVEYLCIMSARRRTAIENRTKYFHALLESDEDGDLLISQNDWQGGLNALRRDLQQDQEENNEANQRALEQMRSDLNSSIAALQKQMTSMLEDLSDEIKDIKKIQAQGGVTFNGKNVAKAVKAVKSIGKGAFWNNDHT